MALPAPGTWWDFEDLAGHASSSAQTNQGYVGASENATIANSPSFITTVFGDRAVVLVSGSSQTARSVSNFTTVYGAIAQMTAAVMFRPRAQGAATICGAKKNSGPGVRNGYEIRRAADGSLSFWAGNGPTEWVASGGNAPDEVWTDVFVTFDAFNVMKIYVNGVLVGSAVPGNFAGIGTAPHTVGDEAFVPGSAPFAGDVADFRFWPFLLNATNALEYHDLFVPIPTSVDVTWSFTTAPYVNTWVIDHPANGATGVSPTTDMQAALTVESETFDPTKLRLIVTVDGTPETARDFGDAVFAVGYSGTLNVIDDNHVDVTLVRAAAFPAAALVQLVWTYQAASGDIVTSTWEFAIQEGGGGGTGYSFRPATGLFRGTTEVIFYGPTMDVSTVQDDFSGSSLSALWTAESTGGGTVTCVPIVRTLRFDTSATPGGIALIRSVASLADLDVEVAFQRQRDDRVAGAATTFGLGLYVDADHALRFDARYMTDGQAVVVQILGTGGAVLNATAVLRVTAPAPDDSLTLRVLRTGRDVQLFAAGASTPLYRLDWESDEAFVELSARNDATRVSRVVAQAAAYQRRPVILFGTEPSTSVTCPEAGVARCFTPAVPPATQTVDVAVTGVANTPEVTTGGFLFTLEPNLIKVGANGTTLIVTNDPTLTRPLPRRR